MLKHFRCRFQLQLSLGDSWEMINLSCCEFAFAAELSTNNFVHLPREKATNTTTVCIHCYQTAHDTSVNIKQASASR